MVRSHTVRTQPNLRIRNRPGVPARVQTADMVVRYEVAKTVQRIIRKIPKTKTRNGKTLVRISHARATLIVEAVVELIFEAVYKMGYYRLPGGFGALKVVEFRIPSRRIPSGRVVTFTEPRKQLRYVEGVRTRSAFGKTDDYQKNRQFPITSAVKELLGKLPARIPDRGKKPRFGRVPVPAAGKLPVAPPDPV